MTKKELIGRKFMCGTSPTVYTIKHYHIKEEVNVTWLNDGRESYKVTELSDKFVNNIWKLLPEEPKTYTTPKGIKYGVGTKFNFRSTHYNVVGIEPNIISYNKISNNQSGSCSFRRFSEMVDNGTWNIIQNYQSVDPTTIKFDFTNIKIKVDTPEESEWVCKVIYNNIRDRFLNTENTIKTAVGYYVSESNFITFTSQDFYEYGKLNKEITIQDILNNQMKEVIEVGDTVCSIMFNDEDLIVESIIGTRLQFTKGTWLDISTVKLKLKANKQEVIGYELLKDLPGIPAGTQAMTFNKDYAKFGTLEFHGTKLQDITWFKPIYKAIKPTEVFVDTLAGKVKVKKDLLGIGTDYIHPDFLKNITDVVMRTNNASCYNIRVETFKVGCKTFHVDDILKIQEAINQVQ